jgi:hypothetical protein
MMPRRRQDVDWYCEMSEWLERRESRRKWIFLAIFIAIPVFLMGLGVVAIKLHEKGGLSNLKAWWTSVFSSSESEAEAPPPELEVFDPVTIESIIQGGIKFSQLDPNGLPTTITYFFKEVAPIIHEDDGTGEQETGFVIRRDTAEKGVVEKYVLVNAATGQSFELPEVDARLIDENVGWTITEEGWTKVRDLLAAQMQVKLSRPIFQ